MNNQEEIERIESTVLVKKFRLAAGETMDETSNQYRGLCVHALEGLHSFVADYVRRTVPAGGALLDVCSG